MSSTYYSGGGGGGLTSSTHGTDSSANRNSAAAPAASAFLNNNHHDRSAELIRVLLSEVRWLPHKISLRLNVPIVIVEECSRTGRSSDLLRSQLCHWLRTSGEVPPNVPTALVAAVLAEGQRGAAAAAASGGDGGGGATAGGGPHTHVAGGASAKKDTAAGGGTALIGYSSGLSAFDEDDDDATDDVLQSGPYATLDPHTRAHFNYLRKTVGNNFASVLTDPNDPRMLTSNNTVVAWDWLGNTFSETFVEGGAATTSGPVRPESVYDLLQLHPVTKATFQPYLEGVSKLYNANRVEVSKMKEFQTIKSAFHRELERVGHEEENLEILRHTNTNNGCSSADGSVTAVGSGAAAMQQPVVELPWPEDVPLTYFDTNYSFDALLRSIPAKSVCNVPWVPPATGAEALQVIRPKLSSTRPLPPSAVVGGGMHQNTSAMPAPPLPLPSSSSSAAAADAEVDAKAAAYLEQLITEMTSNEQNVELCLITHVLSQSEAFFEASKSFECLRDDSGGILQLLNSTRVGVMGKGEGVVQQFLEVLRLHRRRARLQEVLSKLKVLDRFCGSLRALNTAQMDEVHRARQQQQHGGGSSNGASGGHSIAKITTALSNALKLRFGDVNNSAPASGGGGGVLTSPNTSAAAEAADFIGQLQCLNNATAALLMSKRNIQEVVANRACAALQPSEWCNTDWDDIHQYLGSAAQVGALPMVVQQYQRDVTEHIWQVVAKVVVVGASSSHSAPNGGSGGGVSAKIAAAVSNPNERRRILRSALGSLKTPHFIAQIADVVNALQDYSIQLVTHLTSLNEILIAIGTLSAAGGDESSPQQQQHQQKQRINSNAVLDEDAVKAILLQSLQVSIIEVLESREKGDDGDGGGGGSAASMPTTTQMTFADVETLLRVCFAFANDIESFFGFPTNSQTRPFRATLQTIARSFFKHQHERQQEKMLTVLSLETWTPNEMIEGAYQQYCDHLCGCSRESIAKFQALSVEKSSLTVPDGTAPKAAMGAVGHHHRSGAATNGGTAEAEGQFEAKLRINAYAFVPPTGMTPASPPPMPNSTAVGRAEFPSAFAVPNSLLMLLQSLHDYDRYFAAFPFLAADIIMRVHDALKLYDGQCAGLVLGAGAVETGALQAITVAHLALSSQCAGFLAELAPRLQRRLRLAAGVEVFPDADNGQSTTGGVTPSPSPPPSTVTSPLGSSSAAAAKLGPFFQHLDRVSRDLHEHRCEYMAKVAAMVKDKVGGSLWRGGGGSPPEANAAGSPNSPNPSGPPPGVFDPRTWNQNKSQWVMMMLKEAARIIKHIKPIVRPEDQKGIIVPVLSVIINKINEGVRMVSTDVQLFPALKEFILADLALIRANIDKFGFDTVQCAGVKDVKTALSLTVQPSSDADFYAFFFGN